ncbi:YndJ family protein [Halobacillus sp. A5]|uniref:YndJ family protein n=1 Tax=Halobacillus sp. A5 TaxID=2880263 RepID=UPI0020A67DB7|nr:YndJ family protein [Halobacillus sp. A5]MCP3029312.1 YndJ family protein [Halobacillus sp. A5]
MKYTGAILSLAGTIILMIWLTLFDMSLIDIALSFSFLILVPLLLEEVVRYNKNNRAEQWIRNVMITSLPFAGAGMLSVALPPGTEAGGWALIWLFFTILIAVGGLMRLLGRGIRPVEETVIDIGLIYIAVGGGWLVLSSGGAGRFLPYSDTIVQLTAIHFHYAAFVVPIVTGLFGRWLVSYKKQDAGLAYRVLASGIASGPVLVAAGLNQGPPLEAFLVAIYVIFLLWMAVWWVWCSAEFPMGAKIAIRLSSMLLIISMSLSVVYSFGLTVDTYWLGIGEMVRWHGVLNAFGFSLFSVMAWRSLKPAPNYIYTSFPVTNLRARGYVGYNIVYKKGWDAGHIYETGLVDDFSLYHSKYFKPEDVAGRIQSFYENTNIYSLEAEVEWQKGFHRISKIINKWTRKMGQINIPVSGPLKMAGEVVSIDDDQDGRKNVKAWLRRNAVSGEPIFAALYSSHLSDKERYMNIGLPLPVGVMTGVLRPLNAKGGSLILTSERQKRRGDEGIYLTLGDWTVRLPLGEYFYVRERTDGNLEAEHVMKWLKIPFLKINYTIKEKGKTTSS